MFSILNFTKLDIIHKTNKRKRKLFFKQHPLLFTDVPLYKLTQLQYTIATQTAYRQTQQKQGQIRQELYFTSYINHKILI